MIAEIRSIFINREQHCFLMNIFVLPFIALNMQEEGSMPDSMAGKWRIVLRKRKYYGKHRL